MQRPQAVKSCLFCKLIFGIDIVIQNYLTQTLDGIISNWIWNEGKNRKKNCIKILCVFFFFLFDDKNVCRWKLITIYFQFWKYHPHTVAVWHQKSNSVFGFCNGHKFFSPQNLPWNYALIVGLFNFQQKSIHNVSQKLNNSLFTLFGLYTLTISKFTNTAIEYVNKRSIIGFL